VKPSLDFLLKSEVDLDLKRIGDEHLITPSDTIKEITQDVIDLAEEMKVKMVEWNGIGLAAPQVGHNIRLIVLRLSTGTICEMINPRISWCSEERVSMEEGCLSIPGTMKWIERPRKVRVKFQQADGQYKYWCLNKMDARVLFHEYDHLDGILMVDK